MRANPLLWAALFAGASYCVPAWGEADGAWIVAWKGAGVGLLALWAGVNARSAPGWAMTAVLALHALGDVLLNSAGFVVGGAAFALGHAVAAALYLGQRRRSPSPSQIALAVTLLVTAPLLAWMLTGGGAGAAGVVVYAGILGVMASTAWLSRLPRYRVGLGAVLFVLSDLLIFGRMGMLAGVEAARWPIWPLYFAGQALIAIGAVPALQPAAPPLHRGDADIHDRI